MRKFSITHCHEGKVFSLRCRGCISDHFGRQHIHKYLLTDLPKQHEGDKLRALFRLRASETFSVTISSSVASRKISSLQLFNNAKPSRRSNIAPTRVFASGQSSRLDFTAQDWRDVQTKPDISVQSHPHFICGIRPGQQRRTPRLDSKGVAIPPTLPLPSSGQPPSRTSQAAPQDQGRVRQLVSPASEAPAQLSMEFRHQEGPMFAVKTESLDLEPLEAPNTHLSLSRSTAIRVNHSQEYLTAIWIVGAIQKTEQDYYYLFLAETQAADKTYGYFRSPKQQMNGEYITYAYLYQDHSKAWYMAKVPHPCPWVSKHRFYRSTTLTFTFTARRKRNLAIEKMLARGKFTAAKWGPLICSLLNSSPTLKPSWFKEHPDTPFGKKQAAYAISV